MGLKKLLVHKYNPQTNKMDEFSAVNCYDLEYKHKRFFKNNEKPATHFMEVYRRFGTYGFDNKPVEYGFTVPYVNSPVDGVKAIAIFKIRMK